jgi:hypothetical protein
LNTRIAAFVDAHLVALRNGLADCPSAHPRKTTGVGPDARVWDLSGVMPLVVDDPSHRRIVLPYIDPVAALYEE